MAAKITGLTSLNVQALGEVFPAEVKDGAIVLTATTATFHIDVENALWALDYEMNRLPTRGHPRHSLHAVRRKLVKFA